MSKEVKDIDLVKENAEIKAKLDTITNANALKENETLKKQLKEAEAKQKELKDEAETKAKEIKELSNSFDELSKKIETKLETEKEKDEVEIDEVIEW